MSRSRVAAAALALAAAAVSLAFVAVPALAADATFSGSTADGSHVFFTTSDKLAADDTSSSDTDIYDRSGGTTIGISTAPNGGVQSIPSFGGASTDGSRVFFQTGERLNAADTDLNFDIYEHVGSATNLISRGDINGNSDLSATFRGASADGASVFFTTQEQLVAADTDNSIDIYQRSAGATTLVSRGQTNGNGAFAASFTGASDDGTHVFFTTSEPLLVADTDTSADIYDRSGGTTTLVSAGQINGNTANNATFRAASADGTRVLFTTNEQLVAADTDNFTDVYQRSAGTTSLVSAGQINGNGPVSATFAGASDDATRVYFTTDEQLVSGDTDSSTDIYLRDAGTTTQVSTGTTGGNGAFVPTFNATSADGSKAFFTTAERLKGEDQDNQLDIYQSSGGTTTMLARGSINTGNGIFSFGNGPFDTIFKGVSADGTKVFFETAEPMDLNDGDEVTDVYRTTANSATTLISRGAVNGQGAFPAHFSGASSDGTHAFFTSYEQLTPQDIDADRDIYERTPGSNTVLVSIETIPPETTIGDGVADGGATTDTTPVFEFSSSEAGSSFQCSVDGVSFSACTSPKVLGPLLDGSHTFAVKATDPAGNTDSSPASRTFTVDTIPPDVSIDSGPTGPTKDSTPTFTFSADETVTFACRVDSDAYAPCSGPGDSHTTSALSDGSHTFHLRARDAAGNTEFTRASFAVDTVPPETSIGSVTVTSSTGEAQVSFSGVDPVPGTRPLTFRCKLDAAPVTSCTSPAEFKGLSAGHHVIRIRAVDAAGNVDPTPASKGFNV